MRIKDLGGEVAQGLCASLALSYREERCEHGVVAE